MSRRTELEEARTLRDSALALFRTDLALIKTDLRERGLGARIADRIGDGTLDIVDDAVDYAEENRGKIAAIVAAAMLWFARKPLLGALSRLLWPEDDEATEPGHAADRSQTSD